MSIRGRANTRRLREAENAPVKNQAAEVSHAHRTLGTEGKQILNKGLRSGVCQSTCLPIFKTGSSYTAKLTKGELPWQDF